MGWLLDRGVRTRDQTLGILADMRKRTTVNLDRDLKRVAAEILGTSTIIGTVHAALAEAVARDKLRKRAWLGLCPVPDLTAEALDELRR